MKKREYRKVVNVPVRVLTDAGWTDAIIRNVSSRGVMIELSGPAPIYGSYIELRRATTAMAGRVRWSCARRCGVSIRERIDVPLLETGSGDAASLPQRERRCRPRPAPRRPLDGSLIRRRIEAAAIGAGSLAGAMVLAGLLYHLLATTAQQIVTAGI